MILLSLVACVASSIFLVAIGGETKYGLYAGTGIFNFLYDIEIDIKSKTIDEKCDEKKFISLYFSGLLGLFISWQYGACYSWIAQKGDISGRPASIFFIG